MSATRDLFVDDENNLRLAMLPQMSVHGFEVYTATDRAEITIRHTKSGSSISTWGKAGDGLPVVSTSAVLARSRFRRLSQSAGRFGPT